MATAGECRTALESLLARIGDLDEKKRKDVVLDRTLSLRIPDLGLTFITKVGPEGNAPIRESAEWDGGQPAQVRFTASSDDVVKIGDDPGSFIRLWLSGKLKVDGSVLDLLRLRKVL